MKILFTHFRLLLVVATFLMVCNACSGMLNQSGLDEDDQITQKLKTVCEGKPVHLDNVTRIETQIENLNFAQVIDDLGPPDIVYGTLMWLECELDCPYAVGLLYNDLGIWLSASGEEAFENVIRMDNGIVGIRLTGDEVIDAIYCFTPNELDSYLAGKDELPNYLSSDYINKWQGLGMVVPIPP